MKWFVGLVIAGVLMSGCESASTTRTATTTSQQPATMAQATPSTPAVAPAQPTVFTGEVWTWDEQDNTITLMRGTEKIRVRVTPDQFIGLTLHSIRSIRGTLEPPKELERVTTAAPANYAVVPRGSPQEAEITGKVTTVSGTGIAAIDSARGPLQVWVATPQTQVQQGRDVRLRVTVQPVDIVARDTATPAATPAPPSAEPGEYAVVTGRIVRIDPSGRMSVESPRGPIDVWVSDASKFRLGDVVQVRTWLQAAR